MKKTITKSKSIRYEIEDTLKGLKESVDKWIEQYGEDAVIEIDSYEEYGSIAWSASICYKVQETEDEMKERERQEKLVADFRAKREHEEYLKLKAKFEKSDEQSS